MPFEGAAPPELVIDVVPVGAAAVRVTVAGDVDACTAEQLRRRLVEAVDRYRPRSVIVDCAGVPFLDAAGITALIQARGHAARHQAEVRLVGAGRLVRRILAVAGLAETFGVTQD